MMGFGLGRLQPTTARSSRTEPGPKVSAGPSPPDATPRPLARAPFTTQFTGTSDCSCRPVSPAGSVTSVSTTVAKGSTVMPTPMDKKTITVEVFMSQLVASKGDATNWTWLELDLGEAEMWGPKLEFITAHAATQGATANHQ